MVDIRAATRPSNPKAEVTSSSSAPGPSPTTTRAHGCPCQALTSVPKGGVFSSGGTNQPPTVPSFGPSSNASKDDSNGAASQKVVCPACIHALLHTARERRARVQARHQVLRANCQATLEATPPWTELQQELLQLQQESERLRTTNNQLALQTAKLACHNQERQTKLQQQQRQVQVQQTQGDVSETTVVSSVQWQRDWLRHLQTVLLSESSPNDDNNSHGPGALPCGIAHVRDKVRRLRFQWAVTAFELHRLDVSSSDVPVVGGEGPARRRRHLTMTPRGIGKIAGLPLPHAGPELYSVLPPQELQSALRLVASLTSLVASCLGIALPHPILLTPPSLSPEGSPQQANADLTSHVVNLSSSPISSSLSSAGAASSIRPPMESHHFGATTATSSQPAKPSSSSSASALAASTVSAAASWTSSLVGQTAQRVWTAAAAGKHPTTKPISTRPSRTVSPPVSHTTATPRPTTTTIRTTTTRLEAHSLLPPPLLNGAAVQQRIHHATCAVLAEKPFPPSSHFSSSSSTGTTTPALYSLCLVQRHASSSSSCDSAHHQPSGGGSAAAGPDGSDTPQHGDHNNNNKNEEEFAIALQLLQNNIVALCIRAGAPVDRLLPAQAVLLNLHVLHQFCRQQAQGL